MVQPNQSMAYGQTRTQAEIDAGLRSFMLRVYNYMALGVAFTAVVVLLVGMSPAFLEALITTPLKWVAFAGVLGMGFFAPRLMIGGSVVTAQVCFWVYAALWGVLIAPMVLLFLATDPTIVVRALMITTATFAGVSLFGYVTKKNLNAFATFFMIAMIGLLIAIVANVFFFQDTGMSLIISCAVVLLFAGVTAWETQQIKAFYLQGDGHDVATKKAIFGAFMLYGSFVTLFIHILNILGIMRGE